MRRICTIDAETDPFRRGRIPKPFLWGFWDGVEYLEFERTEDFAEFLYDERCVAYAHNGGKFDFHYLLPYLEEYSDISIINGRIARMRIGNCELRDSYCILPFALAVYQKDQIDYALFEARYRDRPEIKKQISAYLQSDCRYLHQMVSAFKDRFGDNLTLAGAAMKHWQKLSKRELIPPLPESGKDLYKKFAPFYYGGRVECFTAGIIDDDFAVYDINSAYPYAMMFQHPYSDQYEEINGYANDGDFYIVRCISGGVFPYRGNGAAMANEQGLHFPLDEQVRTYMVTSWEYRAALETNAIREIEILETYRFARHETFREYVIQFWDERQKAKENEDVLSSIFAKLMMNSLYGKFAANPETYKNYLICNPDDGHIIANEDSIWQYAGELGPWLLGAREIDDERKRYYNVATGASITGFVRAMLWRTMCSSEGVMYCDTDSIACRKKGDMVIGDELGQWKHEGDFDKAGIAGKKMYIFRGVKEKGKARKYKTASKGVRLTHGELWRVAAGESVEYSSAAPSFSIHRPMDYGNPSDSFIKRNVVLTAKEKL